MSNFMDGPDGWYGPVSEGIVLPLITTVCKAPLGTILGGLGTASKGTTVQKKFVSLPPHGSLLVKMEFAYLGWAEGQTLSGLVKADGVTVWKKSVEGLTFNDACGGNTGMRSVRVFIADHTADSVTLLATTENSVHSGEQFGIANVEVIAFDDPSAKGTQWAKEVEKPNAAQQLGWITSVTDEKLCPNLVGVALWSEEYVLPIERHPSHVVASISFPTPAFFATFGATLVRVHVTGPSSFFHASTDLH